MLSRSYQLRAGHVAALLSSCPATCRISACFELSPKCDDNSHEQNTKTKTATSSKMRSALALLISLLDFFFFFYCSLFDRMSWHNWACGVCVCVCSAQPNPQSRNQLHAFSDSLNKGEVRSCCCIHSEWRVCVTQGLFLDQRSHWLSLNITVPRTSPAPPPLMASSDCAMRNKSWLYEKVQEKKYCDPISAAGCGLCQWLQTDRSVRTDLNRGTIMG